MPSKLQSLAYHQKQVERWTIELIMDELSALLPGLEKAQEQTERVLSDAEKALELPTAEIASVDADIKRAQSRMLDFQWKVNSEDMDTRIDARKSVTAYSEEIRMLEDKRQQMRDNLQVFVNARNKAADDVGLIKAAHENLMAAILNPLTHQMAQATEAYVAHRQPYINHVIIGGGKNHPEWECAVDEIVLMAQMAGIKRGDLRLPDMNENLKAYWDSIRNDANPVTPPPSGAEVVAEMHSEMHNAGLQKQGRETVNAIEDHRPKANYVRSYLSAPRVPDDMRQRNI